MDAHDEKTIRSFLEKHPGYTVFGGSLYRYIDGDLFKGTNVVMYASNTLREGDSFEGSGASVEEALISIAKQMGSSWGQPKSRSL